MRIRILLIVATGFVFGALLAWHFLARSNATVSVPYSDSVTGHEPISPNELSKEDVFRLFKEADALSDARNAYGARDYRLVARAAGGALRTPGLNVDADRIHLFRLKILPTSDFVDMSVSAEYDQLAESYARQFNIELLRLITHGGRIPE